MTPTTAKDRIRIDFDLSDSDGRITARKFNMTKILLVEGENVKLIEKTGFAQEATLQDYLEKYPSAIPLTDIIEDAPDLLPIGREVPAGQGSVDLLLIDRNGLLTVVETKLARNPQVRREVVGQIIEYASYISKWNADDIYRIANDYFESEKAPKKYRNKTFDDAIRDFGAESIESTDDFRLSIQEHLKNGRMRLIIAVDELVEPLRAMVTFLNSYSNFDIFLLQVASFEESPFKKVLFPILFGYTPRTAQTASKVRQTQQWDEASFFSDAAVKSKPEIVDTIKKLYEFSQSKSDIVKFGKGSRAGSFTFQKIRQEKPLSIFTVQSDGKWYTHIGPFRENKIDKNTVKSFIKKLNMIPGVNISDDAKFPYFEVKALSDETSLRKFKEAVLAFCRGL